MGSPTTPEKTPRLKSWKTRRSPTGEKSISSKKFLKETKAKNWERWKHWRFGFWPGLQCSNAFECWKMPFLKADFNLGEAQLTLNRHSNIYKNWIVNAQWSISKILPDTSVDHAVDCHLMSLIDLYTHKNFVIKIQFSPCFLDIFFYRETLYLESIRREEP